MTPATVYPTKSFDEIEVGDRVLMSHAEGLVRTGAPVASKENYGTTPILVFADGTSVTCHHGVMIEMMR